MIDESVMNKVIPLPDENEKMEAIQAELIEKGFPIKSFKKGGIMYHLLRLNVSIYLELKELARTILNACFLQHAEGDWLDIKVADFSKSRIEATKTRGYVTIYRNDSQFPLKVTKGHGFKTEPDSSGKEYKFYVVEDTILPAGEESGIVLVEAAESGTAYNIAAGRITVSMIYLDTMDYVTNESGWMVLEGADEESDAALRARGLASWSELATYTIDTKLKNTAMGIPGVVSASVNSQHPRGQGTVDIIITGTIGQASSELIKQVQDAVDKLNNGYADYLVKSAEVIEQPISVVIYLASDAATDGVDEQARQIIENLMQISREDLNALYRDLIIQELADKIVDYKRTEFLNPQNDIELPEGKVIITPGDQISVVVKNIQRK